MAVGLDVAFLTAKTSMFTRQKELAVISNNVAKVSDKGYHRQKAELDSNIPILGYAGYFGTGVHVSTITRYYDDALETSLRQTMSQNYYYQRYSADLGQIEDLVGAQGTNPLNDSIYEFAGNVQDLASFPESIANRTGLINAAQSMAAKFNQEYENLRKIRDNVADEVSGNGAISDRVSRLNDLVSRIPDLNDRIRELEQNAFLGQTANDLRDERVEILTELSQLADINVTEHADYRVSVTIGGHTLVDGTAGPPTTVNTINFAMTAAAPHNTPTLTWSDDASAVSLAYGEIKASVDSRAYIAGKMDDLFSFAQVVANTINTQHAAGFDLDGNAGGNFLSTPGVQPAIGTIMSVLITDPRTIAASGVAGLEGNGANAQAIWNQMNTSQAALSQDSILTYANRYLGIIAEDVAAADDLAQTSLANQEMFQNAVYEYSSVNMDQEMTEMLEVQKVYQASARLLTVIDQMIGEILNLR